jgi:hypothetical protein
MAASAGDSRVIMGVAVRFCMGAMPRLMFLASCGGVMWHRGRQAQQGGYVRRGSNVGRGSKAWQQV